MSPAYGDGKTQRLFYWLNGFVLVAMVVWMGWLTAYQITTTTKEAEANKQQIIVLQQQNEQQLCAQRNTLLAVKKTNRSLGLPVDGIVPPDTEGFDCDAP